MEDHTVRTHLARWRWLALLAVFAMVVAACSSDTTDDTDAGDDGTTTTTAAESTTTAPSGDGSDTTQPDTTPEGFSYNIAIFSDPTTDNPWAALDTESDVWTNYTLPGGTALYGYQPPTYTVVPALAADDAPPTPVADGDGYAVTVALNEGQVWTDGEAITADDVVFTYETVRDLGLGGNFLAGWPLAADDDPGTEEDESANGITNLEALDEYTVKISFNFDPGLAVWPYSVGLTSIFPEHFWGPIVAESGTLEDLYAASGLEAPQAGAFVIAEREPGAFWRNEAIDYWDSGAQYTVYENGAVEYTSGDGTTETYAGPASGEVVADYTEGPYASEVVFSLYSDQNSAILALTDGDVEFMLNPLGLQRGLQQLVLAEPELNIIVNEQLGFRYLAFNVRKFPMSDKAFRQAIACRIDKEFMANTVLGGAAFAADSLVPPGNAFWYNPDIQPTCGGQTEEERVNSAIQILKDAGWSWDVEPQWNADNLDVLPKGEGITGPNGESVPQMELLAPGPGYDPLRATYSLFIEEWAQDLGFPVRAEPTGFSVIVDKVFPPAPVEGWDMYILGWGIGPFPDYVFDFFASANDSADGGFNTPGFSNEEFDALYADFQAEKTLEGARDIIFQADAIVAEELPYVVLFTTPIIEDYRTSLNFPYTSVLDGIQGFNGAPTAVTSS